MSEEPTTIITSDQEVIVRPEVDGGFDPDQPAEGTRIIEFEQGGATFRVQIKDSQRFTFGAFSPGGKGYHDDSALRIYEGANKENQIAVFRNVASVRDLSIKVMKKIGTAKGDSKFEKNADGSSSESRVERSVDWIPF